MVVSTQLKLILKLDTFHDRIRLKTIDGSCDLCAECADPLRMSASCAESKHRNNGTEQMDGNVLLLLFDVFLFGHLLCFTLK